METDDETLHYDRFPPGILAEIRRRQVEAVLQSNLPRQVAILKRGRDRPGMMEVVSSVDDAGELVGALHAPARLARDQQATVTHVGPLNGFHG
jgi:hypothetical protein